MVPLVIWDLLPGWSNLSFCHSIQEEKLFGGIWGETKCLNSSWYTQHFKKGQFPDRLWSYRNIAKAKPSITEPQSHTPCGLRNRNPGVYPTSQARAQGVAGSIPATHSTHITWILMQRILLIICSNAASCCSFKTLPPLHQQNCCTPRVAFLTLSIHFLESQWHSQLEAPRIWGFQVIIKHRKCEGWAGRRLSEPADACGQSTWPRQHPAIWWHPALHGDFGGGFALPWHAQVTPKPGEVKSVSPQSRVPFPAAAQLLDARVNSWIIDPLEKEVN